MAVSGFHHTRGPGLAWWPGVARMFRVNYPGIAITEEMTVYGIAKLNQLVMDHVNFKKRHHFLNIIKQMRRLAGDHPKLEQPQRDEVAIKGFGLAPIAF